MNKFDKICIDLLNESENSKTKLAKEKPKKKNKYDQALESLGIGHSTDDWRYFDLKNPDAKKVYTAYVKFPGGGVEEIDVNAVNDMAAREIVKKVLKPEALQYDAGGKIVELTQRFGLFM